MREAPDGRTQADARRLKGLAHPVRVRLLTVLGADGPRKVADLAAAVGEPANSVSFHLRQLEKYGLAERVDPPASAPAGESWWASLETEVLVDPRQWDGDAAEALAALRTMLAVDAGDRVEGLMSALSQPVQPDGKPADVLARTVTGRLTRAEADEFAARLRELLADVVAASEAHGEESGVQLWSLSVVGYPEMRYGA